MREAYLGATAAAEGSGRNGFRDRELGAEDACCEHEHRGGMIGAASQNAIPADSGTPIARRAAISGITPHQQNGESAHERRQHNHQGSARAKGVRDQAVRAAGLEKRDVNVNRDYRTPNNWAPS